jgi:hypothetical protein
VKYKTVLNGKNWVDSGHHAVLNFTTALDCVMLALWRTPHHGRHDLMKNDWRKLGFIFQVIESSLGISLSNFPRVLGFGGQVESDVCDLVNCAGPKPWNSINIETGGLSNRIDYEPGYGTHWGDILFYSSDKKDLVVILDPEVPVGLLFQVSHSNVIKNTDSWRRDFHYSAEWRKECSKDPKERSYIDEWPTLLEEFTNTPRLEL